MTSTFGLIVIFALVPLSLTLLMIWKQERRSLTEGAAAFAPRYANAERMRMRMVMPIMWDIYTAFRRGVNEQEKVEWAHIKVCCLIIMQNIAVIAMVHDLFPLHM